MMERPAFDPDSEYGRRFGGLARLYGAAGMARIQAAHVCVVGLGGVGSWVVEALARSGIGALTLVDLDDVCVTNMNRQLLATTPNIGRPKATVLAERVHSIHPDCRVDARVEFFVESTTERILSTPYDFVVDGIDRLSNKLYLVGLCRHAGIPVITVGGAAGKWTGVGVTVGDLADIHHDPLLRMVRKRLRRNWGYPRGGKLPMGVLAVSSPEPIHEPAGDVPCDRELPADGSGCDRALGSASFVTGMFGLAAAGEVVRRIALDMPRPEAFGLLPAPRTPEDFAETSLD